tara:strand:+ start:188 stop:616 length:429 start_codon:yes stop_codon:yes gene_type:complete
MLDILSYIIKLIFSISLTYGLVYFYKKNSDNIIIDIVKYNFVCILALSPIYKISIDYNSLILISVLIIILFAYIYHNVNPDLKFLYIFSLIIAILIACNYILYSIIGVSLYVFFNNNLIDLINDNSKILDNDDEKNDVTLDE